MNKIRCKLVVLLAILIGTLSLPTLAATKTNAESLDRIVAVVNDAIITQSDLDAAIRSVKKQIKSSGMNMPPEETIRKQVLDQIINRKIQLQLAEQAGIQITPAQIDKAIENIAAQNKMSVKELLSQVVAQGLSVPEYRKELHDEITIQQVQQQEIGGHIVISPQEVEDMMRSNTWQVYNNKEYHLEDILITLPEAPSPQDVAKAKKKAQEVLAKLHSGKSFQEVAMEESGSSGALQGGDLGWRKLPQIPSAFASELVHMKKNDILGPVQTPNGFHLVKLTDIRDTGKAESASAQKRQVEELLYRRKMEEGLQSWITKIRSGAFINTNPEQ